jgi:hypothetical protein
MSVGAPSRLSETASPAFHRLLEQPARLLAWARLLVVCFPLLLYAGSLASGFLIDDEIIVVSNLRLAPGQGPLEIFRRPEQFADFTLPYYRPLHNLSYWLDARLWDGHPTGHHVTNWLLNAAAALLLFELVRRLADDTVVGLLAALLFAAHPIHTESVDMVQGRTDLLVTVLGLSALLAARRMLQTPAPLRAAATGLLALAAFAAALLAKEAAVAWLLLLGGLAWITETAMPRRRLLLLAGGTAVLVVYFALRHVVLGAMLPGAPGELFSPRLGLAPITLLTYLRMLVWPFTFSFIHAIASPASWADPRLAASAAVGLLLLVGLWLLARRDRLAAFGAGWTLATLIPVLGLVPIPGFTVAERYLYGPSAGFCLLLALLVRRGLASWTSPRGQVVLLGGLSLVLTISAAAIQLRTAEWGDPVAAYEGMAARSPDSFFVQSNLGIEYLKVERTTDALVALTRARELQPESPIAWNNLGVALFRAGRLDEARLAYQRAISLHPAYAQAYDNLAQLLTARGERAAATAAARRARELRGNLPRP